VDTAIGFIAAIAIWVYGIKLLFNSYYWGNSEWVKSWILVYGSLFYLFVIAPIIVSSGYIILIIAVMVVGIYIMVIYMNKQELKEKQEQEVNLNQVKEELTKQRIKEIDIYLDKAINLKLRYCEHQETIESRFNIQRPSPFKLYSLTDDESKELYSIIKRSKYINIYDNSISEQDSMRELLNETKIVSELRSQMREKKQYLVISTANNTVTFFVKKIIN